MPLYWDDKTGSLWMEINKFDTEMLYSTGLTAGLGSNDIGLDRGQGGPGTRREVPADRAARDDGAAQLHLARQQSEPRRAARRRGRVRQVDPVGLRGRRRDGRPRPRRRDRLLPARRRTTSGPRLRPGNYRVDRTRSAIDLPWTKGFPKNTEVDTILTFANDGAAAGGRGGGAAGAGATPVGSPIGGGGFGGGMFSGTVGSVTPTADAVTLREHHTFAELPDANYKPRFDDPRAGYGGAAVRRLRGAARHADGPALHPAASAREGRPVGARQRREEADRLLRRSRHARADPHARCSKARAGGTRRSRPPAIATPSRSSCCPRAPTRWTSATT